MPHYTNITGLAGIGLALLALFWRIPLLQRLSTIQIIVVMTALMSCAAIPFGGVSVLELIRGISGDLSITTLVMLTLSLEKIRWQEEKKLALLFIVLTAIILYPCALGLGMVDPYRLGFGDIWFIAGLSTIACIAWLKQQTFSALTIALVLLGWTIGWYESSNLWDYLLDPWLAIYATGGLINSVRRQAITSANTPSSR